MPEEMPEPHNPPEMPGQSIPPPVLPSEPVPPVQPPEPTPPRPRGPWGAWATLGFAFIAVLGVQFFMTVVLAIVYVLIAAIRGRAFNLEAMGTDLATNAWVFALGTILSTPITVGLIVLFIKARNGPSLADYLTLHKPSGRVLAGCLGIQLLFMVSSDLVSHFTGRPIVPESVLVFLRNPAALPLMLLAIVIMAPLAEEIVFRGFMITGLQPRLGAWGAIIISSLLWAVLHVQYDWYGIVTIVVLGLVLGAVRVYTRSLYITIAMHALTNLGATLEGLYFLYWRH